MPYYDNPPTPQGGDDPTLDPTSPQFDYAKWAAQNSPGGAASGSALTAGPKLQNVQNTRQDNAGNTSYLDPKTGTWVTGDPPPGFGQAAPGGGGKPLTIAEITAAYQAGVLGPDPDSNRKKALDMLTSQAGGLQYSADSANAVLNTIDKGKAKNISVADVINDYAKGHLTADGLLQALHKQNFSSDEANIALDLANDHKADEQRTDALQARTDAKNAKADAKNDAKEAWDAQHGTDGMGQGSQFDSNLGNGGALKAYKMGLIDRNDAQTRLIKEGGLNPTDAALTMKMADMENQAADPGTGGSSGPPAFANSSARAAPAPAGPSRATSTSVRQGSLTGGGTTITPHPEGILNDFRTAFAQNLQNNATGLSVAAKDWALQNQSQFLDRYLGQVGVGGVNGGASFTMGANEIQNMYEGSKGSRRANLFAGAGEQASLV